MQSTTLSWHPASGRCTGPIISQIAQLEPSVFVDSHKKGTWMMRVGRLVGRYAIRTAMKIVPTLVNMANVLEGLTGSPSAVLEGISNELAHAAWNLTPFALTLPDD